MRAQHKEHQTSGQFLLAALMRAQHRKHQTSRQYYKVSGVKLRAQVLELHTIQS